MISEKQLVMKSRIRKIWRIIKSMPELQRAVTLCAGILGLPFMVLAWFPGWKEGEEKIPYQEWLNSGKALETCIFGLLLLTLAMCSITVSYRLNKNNHNNSSKRTASTRSA